MKTNAWKKSLLVALALSTGSVSLTSLPVLAASGTTGTSKPAKPDPLQNLIGALEAKMGRTLTTEEIAEVKAALDANKVALDDAQTEFIEDVADATGLSVDKVKAAVKGAKSGPDLLKALAAALGRKLTKDEADDVRYALKERASAKKAAMDTLILTLCSITGLTEDEVKDALKPCPPPPPGDKPTGDKPTGDKPTGDKPTGDKPTGDKPTGGKPTGGKPGGGNCPDGGSGGGTTGGGTTGGGTTGY